MVVVDSLNVHEAPDGAAQRLLGLARETQVSVLEQRDGWTLIETQSGQRGWASSTYLETGRSEAIVASVH